MRGEPAPPATTDPDAGRRAADGTTRTDSTETDDHAARLRSDGSDDPPTETTAVSPVDAESASSVPIPLLILAGLALLLIAGGSAGLRDPPRPGAPASRRRPSSRRRHAGGYTEHGLPLQQARFQRSVRRWV